MIREIVTNFKGYSINDVLATDIDSLHEVLLSKPDTPEEKVVDLMDFVKSRQEGGK